MYHLVDFLITCTLRYLLPASLPQIVHESSSAWQRMGQVGGPRVYTLQRLLGSVVKHLGNIAPGSYEQAPN